eukprot:NODE_4213_length_1098_cov_127.255385_g4015_i0.p1 GENE.NODE_4213_length_1098_cov_127.255385_g4015_i0~~NODE_4213_length_1098_cov_127.255385_g4015_i0.p1  ORF type:complete len:277 (+),score=42.14 NODE_4213_length_1098_cov_127.255385_g4015_i0:59-832(+)
MAAKLLATLTSVLKSKPDNDTTIPNDAARRAIAAEKYRLSRSAAGRSVLLDSMGEHDFTSKSSHKGQRKVICHLCGRQATYAGLRFHLIKCAGKQRVARSELPGRYQVALKGAPEMDLPEAYDTVDYYTQYNKQATDGFQKTLPTCDCGKSFAPQFFEQHIRHCPHFTKQSMGEPPTTVTCTNCGRRTGESSLKFHTAKCLRKSGKQKYPETQQLPECKCGTRLPPRLMVEHLKNCVVAQDATRMASQPPSRGKRAL